MHQGKVHVLVVDDEPKYVRAVRANLEASGYEVLVAQNGQTAVELASDTEPDLIVLDVRMPNLDGLGVPAHPQVVQGADHHTHRSGKGRLQGKGFRRRRRRLCDQAFQCR